MAVENRTNLLPRRLRNTFLMAKLESEYNKTYTTAAPLTFTPADDALWVEEVNFSYTSNNQTFNALQPYMGAKIEVAGNDYVDISFKVPVSESPYPVTRDKVFGPLLQACGMKRKQVAAATGVVAKVIYTPTSDMTNANDSACFAFTSDRVRYIATGGRGTWEASFMSNGIPAIQFNFKCMFDGEVGNLNDLTAFPKPAAGQPDPLRDAPEFGKWRLPNVVTARNSSGIYLGSTLDLDTLTFDNGHLLAHKGLSLNFGNNVVFDDRLGGDRMLITDRDVTGTVQLDLQPDYEKYLRAKVRANDNMSLGFVHGVTDGVLKAGETCVIYGPAVQFLNPKIEDVNGTMYTGFDLRFRSLDKNNDASDNYGDNELSIIFA